MTDLRRRKGGKAIDDPHKLHISVIKMKRLM